ncbi:MAG TPA: N-methyl-L-tryptophan oxidase [Candidatus Limnocylindrales bacterium]|nr:N-methyl-L-tryptophan oxidase [Candidatus Limnocylindrales bacterium]
MAEPIRREYAVAVIGLGGIGSGAAYWLSRRLGADVLGLEQFELGHVRGASQDHSRIIRLSYHRPDYVRLAKRAYETWQALETEAGVKVVTITGGLDLWPAGARIPMADYADSLAAEDVPFETLDAAEVIRRWPQWRLAGDTVAIYQAAGGLADPSRANAAHQRLAREHGATLLERTPVTALRDRGGTIEIQTDGGGTFTAGAVVLAADAWTNELLASFDRQLPLTVTREQVTYYACPHPEDFAPDRFPVWIWMDEPSFYGFPTYGEAGPKAAEDVGGRPTTARERSFEPDREAGARLDAFMAAHLPGSVGPEILTKTCLYTLTPDRDFVIDQLPDHPAVFVALGAAHAFKFSSVLGRILSELVVDGATPSAGELERFRIDRPLLLASDPPTSFMV